MTAGTSVAVVGPGAIGGVVAAALASRADLAVTVCARTPFDELRLDHDGTTTTAPVRVVTDPADVSPADLVVLATKTFQTDGAQGWLDALCRPGTVVAALQNGVEHRERLASRIGGAALAPAVVFCPASRRGPGHASLDGPAWLTVPDDAAGRAVADAFAGTLVEVRPVADWITQAWIKLLSNSAGGAVTTLARASNRLLAEDPDAADLVLALMDEAAAVGRAEGATLPDDIGQRILDGVRALAGGHTSSIVVDRVEGRATEWRERNEVIVRLAARHGIDVPLNRAVTTLLRAGEPDAPGRA